MRGQTTTEDGVTAAGTRHVKVRRRPRLPLAVYVLALGTLLMLTSEFVVAGILPLIASDMQVSVARPDL
jgi:DHA1 family inner membrane transport protein